MPPTEILISIEERHRRLAQSRLRGGWRRQENAARCPSKTASNSNETRSDRERMILDVLAPLGAGLHNALGQPRGWIAFWHL